MEKSRSFEDISQEYRQQQILEELRERVIELKKQGFKELFVPAGSDQYREILESLGKYFDMENLISYDAREQHVDPKVTRPRYLNLILFREKKNKTEEEQGERK